MPNTEFSKRLNQACNQLGTVPEYGQGRQVFIARKMKVTQEAARKWFSGDARPKVNKMKELANLLDVDEAWLALGVEPELDRREKRAHGDRTEGAIYAVFGILTLAGGHCAFPSAKDPRAEYVDFYTIMRGTQAAFHVSLAMEVSKGVYQFVVPSQYAEVRCVGLIRHTDFQSDFIDLRHGLLAKHKQRKGGGYAVTLNRRKDGYHTGSDTWPVLQNIGDLL